MRLSRPAAAALRPGTIGPAAVLSAAVCLGAAACGTTAPAAGAAYGTSSAAPNAMTSSTPPASAKATLTVRKTPAGYVLASRTGQTIYWFSHDTQGSGTSTCTGSCLTAWPAVTGTPAAAAGVQLAGKLGTITRPGGVVQATYNGYPLYTYASDTSPGEVSGNGASGEWHIITGAVLTSSPATAAAASLRDAGGAGSSASGPASASSGDGGGGY